MLVQHWKNLPPQRPLSNLVLIEKLEERHSKNYKMCAQIEYGDLLQYVVVYLVAHLTRLTASQVNVPYAETIAHRAKVISLIHPHNTEMDLSISYALYFAARGTGVISSNLDATSSLYTTPARVLLSGLGADELFGGYTRHATAFSRKGFPGLLDELELDVNRLGKRNLGRDDRVISHWGREARFPYLDEELVKWAVETPIWEKCGFHIDAIDEDGLQIEPSKKVLRLLAYGLGMHSVAREKKRAVCCPTTRRPCLLTISRYNSGRGRQRWKLDGLRALR